MKIKQQATKLPILIATNSLDDTISPVVERLESLGYPVITYLADKVASGDTPLEVSVGGTLHTVRYDGHLLDSAHIGAAWYRRPNQFAFTQGGDIASQI